jgi:hypothetical protein
MKYQSVQPRGSLLHAVPSLKLVYRKEAIPCIIFLGGLWQKLPNFCVLCEWRLAGHFLPKCMTSQLKFYFARSLMKGIRQRIFLPFFSVNFRRPYFLLLGLSFCFMEGTVLSQKQSMLAWEMMDRIKTNRAFWPFLGCKNIAMGYGPVWQAEEGCVRLGRIWKDLPLRQDL